MRFAVLGLANIVSENFTMENQFWTDQATQLMKAHKANANLNVFMNVVIPTQYRLIIQISRVCDLIHRTL
ncbi:MAG: hypothetical protein H6567_02755 [Lewinellaceae bacterium]|nr:hypothetical protein [Lewinellaceae bacterium]